MDWQNAMLLSSCLASTGPGALPCGAILSDSTAINQSYSYEVKHVPRSEPKEDTTADSVYTITSLFEKAIVDLDELSTLPTDWDSYGSPKVSNELINVAKMFLSQLKYDFIDAPHVVPISGGGVQFEWQIGERELELEFMDAETIGCLKVRNDEPIEESQFNRNNLQAAQKAIQWLKRGF